MDSEAPAEVQEEVPLDQRAVGAQTRLKEQARRLSQAASTMAPLTKPSSYQDFKKLEALVAKIEAKVPGDLQAEADLGPLLQDIRAFVTEGSDRLRRRLGRELETACREAQIPFLVVSREAPIEIRLQPFSCVLDFDRGQAALSFSRIQVETAAADAQAILGAHKKALRRFEGHFDAVDFFQRCHRAWRAARAAANLDTDRVEILDFLPYLAIEMQAPKFKVDPAAANYKGYDRSQFAYDVMRLRRERKLVQDGTRMNLGVATGTTATEKRRVIYFEDEQGQGEYKLTIFFNRIEGAQP